MDSGMGFNLSWEPNSQVPDRRDNHDPQRLGKIIMRTRRDNLNMPITEICDNHAFRIYDNQDDAIRLMDPVAPSDE